VPLRPTEAQFAPPLQVLFEPKRYKVLYGGRGGMKSWGVARALLIRGLQQKLFILCARELQKSIEDSVHRLLSEQIRMLGLLDVYEIEQARIRNKLNGTMFRFEGIKNNINTVRSMEGVNICWVEEANNVSAGSWKVLIPTIRAEGSEIWLTFNPELEEDYTYKRFVLDPELVKIDGTKRFVKVVNGEITGAPITCPISESSLSIAVKVNWRDNPWFPPALKEELERDRRLDYDKYLHVWEGNCVANLEGAIYAKEMRRAIAEGRIGRVPYEPSIPVDTFWDLGRADSTAIWFVQRVGMQWRILDYYEESLEELNHFLKLCQEKPYFYGTMFLPHDAKHKRLGYKNSIEDQVRARNFTVQIVRNLSRNDGINMARQTLAQCWFDEERCSDGLKALRHYRFQIKDGKLSNEPLHDWASDGADAFRYFAVSMNVPRATQEERSVRTKSALRAKAERWVREVGGQAWMR
jgi:phage terminase large subunit